MKYYLLGLGKWLAWGLYGFLWVVLTVPMGLYYLGRWAWRRRAHRGSVASA